MRQELGANVLNLDCKALRKLGQIKETGLAPLHEVQLPQRMNLSQHKPKFRDNPIDAPPLSSGESEAGSAIHESGKASSGLSEPESVASKKRKRQENAEPRKKEHIQEEEDGHSAEEDPMKSWIPTKEFKNSSQYARKESKSSSSDDSFGWPFRPSSQPKRRYGGAQNNNIHAPQLQRSKGESKKPASAPSSQNIGFKVPATNAADALRPKQEDEKKDVLSTWIKPPAVEVPSPDSKNLRRSARKRQDTSQPPTPKKSSPRSKAKDAFKAPLPNPYKPKFRGPTESPKCTDWEPLEEVKKAKKKLKALGVDLTTQSPDVPSSLPSIKSNIPDDVSETSSLSTAPSSAHVEADGHLLGLHESPATASYVEIDESSISQAELCPACKIPVAKDLFIIFQQEYDLTDFGGRIPWKYQKLFCKMHKIHSAQHKWKEQGYPDIDWDNLPRRFDQYEILIEGILVGKKQSHYRKNLEGKMQSGKKMTFERSLASANETGDSQTGYYGSKGAKIMMEYLAKAFSVLLRNLNTSDKLISASGGVSAYIQAVLVPELATALIKEDMAVDEARAREIIKESAVLGELVNEEEGDVIDEEEAERKQLQDEEEKRQNRARWLEELRQEEDNIWGDGHDIADI